MELFRGVSKNNSLCDRCIQDLLNRFHATDRFWYPLKTSENLWFSDVFQGVSKEISGMKRVTHLLWSFFVKIINGFQPLTDVLQKDTLYMLVRLLNKPLCEVRKILEKRVNPRICLLVLDVVQTWNINKNKFSHEMFQTIWRFCWM